MTLQDHPILLTVSEASELLRLSPNTLQNWLSQGRLKRVKIGRRTFISRKEVEGLLSSALQENRAFGVSEVEQINQPSMCFSVLK